MVLKELILNNFYVGGVVVLKEQCSGPERTDFEQFLCWGCGGLEPTDFYSFNIRRVWQS